MSIPVAIRMRAGIQQRRASPRVQAAGEMDGALLALRVRLVGGLFPRERRAVSTAALKCQGLRRLLRHSFSSLQSSERRCDTNCRVAAAADVVRPEFRQRVAAQHMQDENGGLASLRIGHGRRSGRSAANVVSWASF